MNNRGENSVGKVGLFIGIFITVLVGIILLQSSAQQVGSATNIEGLANQSLGTMTNTTTLHITNCKVLTDEIIFNASGDVAIASTEYALLNNVVYQGAESVSIIANASTGAEGNEAGTATVDGVCQQLGYIPEAGARSIAGLIIIFFALAIAVVTLVPTLREKIFGM